MISAFFRKDPLICSEPSKSSPSVPSIQLRFVPLDEREKYWIPCKTDGQILPSDLGRYRRFEMRDQETRFLRGIWVNLFLASRRLEVDELGLFLSLKNPQHLQKYLKIHIVFRERMPQAIAVAMPHLAAENPQFVQPDEVPELARKIAIYCLSHTLPARLVPETEGVPVPVCVSRSGKVFVEMPKSYLGKGSFAVVENCLYVDLRRVIARLKHAVPYKEDAKAFLMKYHEPFQEGIVCTYSMDQYGPHFMIFQERAEYDLFEAVRLRVIPFEWRLQLTQDFLIGLNEIPAGYVHGDIKPENLLLVSQNGKIRGKIADFGDFRKSDEVCRGGTINYISPEVASKSQCKQEVYIWLQQYGSQADVWAMGMALYIFWTGSGFPWMQTLDGALEAKLASIGAFQLNRLQFPHTTPPVIRELISYMLNPDPSKRIKRSQVLDWFNNAIKS